MPKKEEHKIKKAYAKVYTSEVFSLDYSLIEWLTPRLKLLIEKREEWVEMDISSASEDSLACVKASASNHAIIKEALVIAEKCLDDWDFFVTGGFKELLAKLSEGSDALSY